MISVTDFLRKVLPEGLCLIYLPAADSHKPINSQIVYKSQADMLASIARISITRKDCYFALGTLRQKAWEDSTGRKRKRVFENISKLKSFFVDIDIEPNAKAKYPTLEAAYHALDDLCATYHLPYPIIVHSGGGLHVYWPLKTAVARDKWKLVADVFKRCLIAAGFLFDHTRTADASSVLRVPTTFNVKRDAMVDIKTDADCIDGKEFVNTIIGMANQLGVSTSAVATSVKQAAARPNLFGASNTKPEYAPAKLDKILHHCEQLRQVKATGGSTEPLWYAALTLARHLVNPEEAAVTLSSAHKDYTKNSTLSKLQQTSADAVGPTTCVKFDELVPNVCSTCKFNSFITSPIQLGSDEGLKLALSKLPIRGTDDDIAVPTQADLPHGYKILNGRIFKSSMTPDGKDDLVIDRLFYPVKLLRNEINSHSMLWRAHIPNHAALDIEIPSEIMSSKDKLTALLLEQGFYIQPSTMGKVITYMIAYVKKLQAATKTDTLVTTLGWRDDKSFALSDTLLHPSGKHTVHKQSTELLDQMPGLAQAGTLEGWKEAIQFYNAPQHNMHRLSLYASLGSPLFHMSGHEAAMVYLCGPSGCGKTTVLRAINSVWGHPTNLMINATRHGMTQNAMFSSLGIIKNLPACLDDMTNWSTPALADATLGISQGQGKRRMSRSGVMMNTLAKWSLIAFITSNTEVYGALARGDNGSMHAQAMRVLQFEMTRPSVYTKVQADHFANEALFDHYGHAGMVFMDYVVRHYDEISKRFTQAVKFLSTKYNMRSEERYWVSVLAAAMVAGWIADKVKLLQHFPVVEDVEYGIDVLKSLRTQVKENEVTAFDSITEFLDSNLQGTLIVNTSKTGNTLIEQEPRTSLDIRIERASDTAFISRSAFKQFCDARGASFAQVQRKLVQANIIINSNAKKVLGTGTDFAKGQVRVFIVDMSKL